MTRRLVPGGGNRVSERGFGWVLPILLLACAPVAAQDGRALYHGLGPDAPRARIGRMESRGLTCAGCHGRFAEGGREGRIPVPAIDRAALLAAGTYDAPALLRTLSEGVTPDGRHLAPAMPRFALSANEAEAILHFLGTVAQEDRAGVTGERVVIAVSAAGGGEADALRRALERRWEAAGPRAVHGRGLHFVTLPPDATHRSPPDAFLVVAAGRGEASIDLRALAQRGMPLITARTEVPAGLDAVRIAPGASELQVRLADLVRAGGVEVRERPPPTLSESERVIVVTGGERSLTALAASGLPLASRRVVLTAALARQAPNAVAELLKRGAEVVALHAAADRADPAKLAELIVSILARALVETGRDLTKSRFLAALRRLRIEIEGWPPMDFSRNPASDAIQAIRLTRDP
ncbi:MULTISPECIES: hypothetical protein [unclassified Methylobacterium]|uniref:hypothetical protein n=1 Tax=unclassified Methylobacterium TaxID=2615210 RepID=UPI003701F90B